MPNCRLSCTGLHFELVIDSSQNQRQSSRVGGAKRLSGGPKFEIRHKSRCFQESKIVNWGRQACQLGGQPPLAPALVQAHRTRKVWPPVLLYHNESFSRLYYKEDG